MKLFDNTLNAIEKKLDLTLKRHALLSSNVANSETPNFKAKELDFAGELEKALGTNNDVLVKTNSNHMDLSVGEGAHSVVDNTMPVGADGNNVDLDIVTGKLSQNASDYSKTIDLLDIKLRMLKAAATGKAGF